LPRQWRREILLDCSSLFATSCGSWVALCLPPRLAWWLSSGVWGDFSFVYTKFYSKKFILSTTLSFLPNFLFYSSKIYIVVCEVKKKNCSGESIVEEVKII
jgi:hypothetical protein